MIVQPAMGFHVTSVHSIDVSAMVSLPSHSRPILGRLAALRKHGTDSMRVGGEMESIAPICDMTSRNSWED